MKVEIKNLLYQPLPIMLEGGSVVNIQPRTKKILDDSMLVDKQIKNLLNKEQIKLKKIK